MMSPRSFRISAAEEMWDARYASVMVFEPVAPEFEAWPWSNSARQCAAGSGFSPNEKRAITMFEHARNSNLCMTVLRWKIEGMLFLIGAMTWELAALA